MTTLIVGSFLSLHVACSGDQNASFPEESDASSDGGSANGGSANGGSANGGSANGGSAMSSGGKGGTGISGSNGAGGTKGGADAGDITDASVSDAAIEPDTGTAGGGAGSGGRGGAGGAGAAGKASGGSTSSTDAGNVDAGSACEQLGQCCATVQPPALRPSCELYASAGMQLQCSVLVGFYCGGSPAPDAGSSGCAALATCCASLGAQRASCEQLVSTGVAGACDLFRAALCP